MKCEKGNSSLSNIGSEEDRFQKMHVMLFTENKHPVETTSLVECELKCLNTCSCNAYAYDSVGCSIWKGDLLNLVQLGAGDSSLRTVYIRQAASEFQNHEGVLRIQNLYILLFGSTVIGYSE